MFNSTIVTVWSRVTHYQKCSFSYLHTVSETTVTFKDNTHFSMISDILHSLAKPLWLGKSLTLQRQNISFILMFCIFNPLKVSNLNSKFLALMISSRLTVTISSINISVRLWRRKMDFLRPLTSNHCVLVNESCMYYII